MFTHTLSENVTYTFSNPAASGYASGHIESYQDSSARTITWLDQLIGRQVQPLHLAQDLAIDVFVFLTVDGGTIYYGFTAGQDLS